MEARILPVVRQFATFAGVGAIGTGVQYLLLLALVYGFAVSAPLASTLGMVAGAFTNYVLNRRFTFRSRARHASALPKFMAVAASGLVLNAIILTILIAAGLHFLFGQIAATAAVLFWNFCINRIWTFRTSAVHLRQ